MTEFFAIAKWQMKVDVPGVDGAIILPSGIPLPTLVRRDLDKHEHMARLLLDPQLYLAGLDVAKAAKSCANLASYGWFDGTTPAYDSAEQKQAEWRASAEDSVRESWTGRVATESEAIEDCVRTCIEVQRQLACEALILPSPLLATSEDLTQHLAWLDAGLELAARVSPGAKRVATIAVSDTFVRGVDPWSSRFLDTLLDQVTARAPDGAYIVIEQASHDQMFESNQNVLGTLMRLVRDLRIGGVERVVVPLAGVAGLLAAAVGAEVWGTGWYRGERRVRLPDFEDTDDQKTALPTYYSHPLAGEIHLKADLDTIVAAKQLELVADTTTASADLLRALRSGRFVAEVPEWAATRSNVGAAKSHFVHALVRETQALRGLNLDQRLDAAKRWLDAAIVVAAKVASLGEFHQRTTLSHQRSWRAVLESTSTL